MKSHLFKSALVSLATVLVSQIGLAKTHSPESLQDLIYKVEDSARRGQTPVVMFDLDDTLINTRERTLRILQDFVAQAAIPSTFHDEVQKIQNLAVNQIKFLLTDTLNGVGIIDTDFQKKAGDFWLNHFFTNEYCSQDKATPGAALYLHLLVRAGAKIVYLTGRDTARMGQGTEENLIRNRFPTGSTSTVLIMKPDEKMDDLKFKESQYSAVAAMGEVVGTFENEPANINSMAEAFPQAAAIFLDTIHSPKPDVPEERVQWVANFNLH